MANAREIESTILQELEGRHPCTFEELVHLLPGYTWNQVFAAVDRLSRTGQLLLQHPSRFEYLVSGGLSGAAARSHPSQRA